VHERVQPRDGDALRPPQTQHPLLDLCDLQVRLQEVLLRGDAGPVLRLRVAAELAQPGQVLLGHRRPLPREVIVGERRPGRLDQLHLRVVHILGCRTRLGQRRPASRLPLVGPGNLLTDFDPRSEVGVG
jgi:hypothetical protein